MGCVSSQSQAPNLTALAKQYPVKLPPIPGDILLCGDLSKASVERIASQTKGWLYLNPATETWPGRDPHFFPETISSAGAELQHIPFNPAGVLQARSVELLVGAIGRMPRPLAIQCSNRSRSSAAFLLWLADLNGYRRASVDQLVTDLRLDVQQWLECQLPAVGSAEPLMARSPEVRQLFDPELSSFMYLVHCPDSKEAVVIDPLHELIRPTLTLLSDLGLRLKYVLFTDPLPTSDVDASSLREVFPELQTIMPQGCEAKADLYCNHSDAWQFQDFAPDCQWLVGSCFAKCRDTLPRCPKDSFGFGSLFLEVRSTPGYTTNSVTYIFKTHTCRWAFTGYALLVRGCGRRVSGIGDRQLQRLHYHSVQEQILSLEPDTNLVAVADVGCSLQAPALRIICPRFDVQQRNVSTVAEERKFNPRFRGGEGEFIRTLESGRVVRTSVASLVSFSKNDTPAKSEELGYQGQTYFFHKVTGDTSSSHPQLALFREIIEEAMSWPADATREDVAKRCQQQLDLAYGRAKEELAQWSGPYCMEAGRRTDRQMLGVDFRDLYYYNESTGESSWVDPRAALQFDLQQRRQLTYLCLALYRPSSLSLLVGINYFGSENELHGCVADVHRMLDLLNRFGFPEDERNRRVLVDSPQWPQRLHPTLENMREGIAWLVADAQPGDCLLFHYSGHGGRMPRSDGSPSEWHETLCPVDMETEGMLLDSELFRTLVRPLPAGCRLTCILDSCHSGGVLDLPFLFVGTQDRRSRWPWLGIGWPRMDLWSLYNRYQPGDANGFRTDEEENQGAAADACPNGYTWQLPEAEVLAFTGCASEQTSADVGDVNQQFQLQPAGGANVGELGLVGGHLLLESTSRAGGALTSAFVEAMLSLLQGEEMSFVELLEHLRQRLSEGGFSQVPQLASSLVLDLHEPFSLESWLAPLPQVTFQEWGTPIPPKMTTPGLSFTKDTTLSHGGEGRQAAGAVGAGTRSKGAPYDQGTQGGFTEMLMGAANGFFTAEAVEEAVDLVEEAGDMFFEDDGQDDWGGSGVSIKGSPKRGATMEQIAVTIFVCLALCHWSFTHVPLRAALQELRQGLLHPGGTHDKNHQKRIEVELDQVRVANRRLSTRFMVHVLFLLLVRTMTECLTSPSTSGYAECILVLVVYFHDMQVAKGKVELSVKHVRHINLGLRVAIFFFSFFNDPQDRPYGDKFMLLGTVSLSLEALDWYATALHAFSLASLRVVTALMRQNVGVHLILEVGSYCLVAVVAWLYEHQTRSRISAVITSDETASILAGFRRVLRGDVLLDQDFNVVGSQNTLHRLVESDLSGASHSDHLSFVELLGAADRPKFLDFVSASSGAISPSSLPRGLRVTLCGRQPSGDTGRHRRSLSVDLFHVALPGYHLLAIKEDPESGSQLLEEAPSSQPLVGLPALRVRSEAPSEVVDICQELEEVTLLINTQLEAQDVEEAHLRFVRRLPWIGDDEEGMDEMPSLQKFAGATEWRTLKKKLRRYVEAARQSGASRPLHLGPLMIRLPGQSHNYLRARDVTLSCPNRRINGDEPMRLWLHLSKFDKGKLRKVHEPTLNEISER
eukprot:s2229_g4.t1